MLFNSLVKSNPKHAPGWIAAACVEHAGRMVHARKVSKKGCEICPTKIRISGWKRLVYIWHLDPLRDYYGGLLWTNVLRIKGDFHLSSTTYPFCVCNSPSTL